MNFLRRFVSVCKHRKNNFLIKRYVFTKFYKRKEKQKNNENTTKAIPSQA